MGQRFSEISDRLRQFIEQQKIFFVATAAADGRVNVSPKDMASLRVVDSNQVVWRNLTGSGNETSAHVQENPRMTLMFMALEGAPKILRLYGNASVIHEYDTEWRRLYSLFEPAPGTRQFFELNVDLVQTSCGMGVPLFNYAGERQQLNDWAINKGEDGLKQYWQQKNQISLDGKPTHILSKNN
jgi:hypothetical protein